MNEPERFDARKLFAALARHDVEYVTIGGIAIQAHGGQRLTQDLDLAIAASAENFTRLADAMSDLDARILGPDGRRSRSAPSATLLASSDQWHLITVHGALDLVTVPASDPSPNYEPARTRSRSASCRFRSPTERI